MFLQATAACFREASKMVDAMMQAAEHRKDSQVSRTNAEDVMYVLFNYS
jgi:recyclin-1